MTQLPVIYYDPNGRVHYHDFWKNYCRQAELYYTPGNSNRDLARNWNGKYCIATDLDKFDYLEFRTPEDLTLFLLRWS